MAVDLLPEVNIVKDDVMHELRRLDGASTHLLFMQAADDVASNALVQAKQGLFAGGYSILQVILLGRMCVKYCLLHLKEVSCEVNWKTHEPDLNVLARLI